MRETEYRAWIKSENRMITDKQDFIPLIVTNKGVMKLQPQFKENYYEFLPNDEIELMQWTGLYDKRKNKIYEGDKCLVSCKYFNIKNEESIVIFKDGCFCFQYGCTDDYVKTFNAWDLGSIEVIGNIYENEN